MNNSLLIDKWPKIKFEELENIEVEGVLAGFYKSFFSVLNLPENTVRIFSSIMTSEQT